MLANVYLEWDVREHYDKAVNATDLANAVSYYAVVCFAVTLMFSVHS